MTQFRVSIATVYTYYITAKNEEEACDKAYQAFDKEDPLDYYDPTILGVETLHPGDFGYESENKKSVKKKPVKSRSRKIRYPSCPRCGAKTDSTDMKYNDFDDYGNLFECYVCPECPTRFSITYDGDNENCDWEYDQDSIESLSRKKRFFRRK